MGVKKRPGRTPRLGLAPRARPHPAFFFWGGTLSGGSAPKKCGQDEAPRGARTDMQLSGTLRKSAADGRGWAPSSSSAMCSALMRWALPGLLPLRALLSGEGTLAPGTAFCLLSGLPGKAKNALLKRAISFQAQLCLISLSYFFFFSSVLIQAHIRSLIVASPN